MEKVVERELWVDEKDYQSDTKYTELSDYWKNKINEFCLKGYVIFEDDSKGLIESAVSWFDAWKERNDLYLKGFYDSQGCLPRMINFHEKSKALCELFSSSNALKFQDIIFQEETVLYTSLLFEKGTSQPIHRDIPYFWTNPSNHYFGMWVALEDSTKENGALMGVPGGHKLIDRNRGDFAKELNRKYDSIGAIDKQLWEEYQEKLMQRCVEAGLEKTQIEMNKGDVIVWHPLFPHGGGQLKDSVRTRKSIVYHTIPIGASVHQADVFFNPDKLVNPIASWEFVEVGERKAIKRNVNIGHRADFDTSKIIW
ncbi:MAG: phytanoyl-CoA dioxygenase family protein [Oceanospirillaceae bacterium]|nr:phytanoyl-CoA dioxygenase family protein [Oceanospirillaceae bacterium]